MSIKLILISCFVGFKTCDSFVSLFTAKACRQCTRFNKVFNDIIEKNPGLDYNITSINQNTSSYARHMNVSKIPVVIFEDGTRLTGVPRNYDLIRNKCKSYVKEPRIPLDHLYSAILCRDIYDDSVLHSSEKYIDNPETDVQIMFTARENTLLVSSRGSSSIEDWKNNLNFPLSEFPFESKKKFHSGFLVQYMSVKDNFFNMLDSMLSKYPNIDKVVFSCHSASNGVMSLLSIDFEKINKKYDFEVVSFGSPRLCNSFFKEDFDSRVKFTRYINDKDLVTKVPFNWLGYRHLGSPIWMKNNGKIEKNDATGFQTFMLFLFGIPSADVGVRDHFMDSYVKNIEECNKVCIKN